MNTDIIVVTWGGIGDLVVCTPTLRAIKETHPNRRLIVYCGHPDHPDILKNNPYIDSIRILGTKHMWRYPKHLYRYLFKRNTAKYYFLGFQHIFPNKLYFKHVKEIVPEIFADLQVKLRHKNMQMFFTEKEEQKAQQTLSGIKSPIFIHVHSRSSVNHHWPLENWQALVMSLPEYTFIQVGNPDEPRVHGAIDWRGKTKLREICCLLKFASSFVGVDSGLAHLTNAVELPGVVLWGDSNPVYWGHDNNINIYKGIRCSPCYYYMVNDPCPYGHECMNSITVDEVRRAVIRQVKKSICIAGAIYAPTLLIVRSIWF